MLFLLFLLASALFAQWQPPSDPSIQITREGATWKVTTSRDSEFSLLSAQTLRAKPGDTFEISIRVKVDIHTVALPELVCFDSSGNEIPARSSLADFPNTTTTNWQLHRRAYVARPGTAAVRARLRGSGKGELLVEAPQIRPARIDTYQTGALYSPPHPRLRRGLVLESNLGIVNRELITSTDRDGDGKWAVILADLDKLSEMETPGEDWRTRFEYNPNVVYWSDGAVLKSDTVLDDRPPDIGRALHFRAKAHRGPYSAILSDPGRAVAVSTDGRTWKRFEGGSEAQLGVLQAPDGFIEFWLDACHRDPSSPGPVYFDYVRLFPHNDPAAANRLFAAARQRPVPPRKGAAEERRVPVRIEAPRFEHGANWPVRCGLPIPRGELASPEQATVLASGGSPLSTQNRALATWPDGSVKWLLLAFQHDFSISHSGQYTVAYGNHVHAVAPSQRVTLLSTAQGIEVDTGAIQFRVPKSRFGILERVHHASTRRMLQTQPVAVEITESSGKIWSALQLPVERLVIEESGPLHVIVLAETRLAPSGQPASGFFHRARIHAYAGSPLVEVDYFVANTDDREQLNVRSISLRWKPDGSAPDSGDIIQKDAEAGQAGWVSPRGEMSLSAGVAGFREQYPKAIRWTSDTLSVDLWAPEGGDYEWVQGVGKTHRISLFYGPPSRDASLLAHGVVLALAEPEWYTSSGAFGPIESAARSPLPDVESTLAAHMRDVVAGKAGLGFENYGDHSSSGYVKGSYLWDNNEYDLPAGAIVHFARTGDRDALRIGLASALHYVDVDCIHYSRGHAGWFGAAHTHSHSTFGHHTAEAPNMHHAGYVQGLLLYTYLTGQPEGLNGARGIADWCLRNLSPESNTGVMERALGHPLMTLNDVYEATWDDAYLRGSARLVDWAMKWEHPERGGFLAPITEQPAFYSGSPFCGGLIPSALLQFNSWARLPEIDQLLERTARWLLTDMWRPPAGIMSKGGSPRRTADPQHISSHLRMLRDVYTRTGDPLFLTIPREAILAGFGRNAKPIGTRSTGLVFNYLSWFLPLVTGPSADPLSRDIQTQPGEVFQACFDVADPSLSASFQPRPDFTVLEKESLPRSLCYKVRAPDRINLTSAHNRVSYAHFTSATAHTWVRITLSPE